MDHHLVADGANTDSLEDLSEEAPPMEASRSSSGKKRILATSLIAIGALGLASGYAYYTWGGTSLKEKTSSAKFQMAITRYEEFGLGCCRGARLKQSKKKLSADDCADECQKTPSCTTFSVGPKCRLFEQCTKLMGKHSGYKSYKIGSSPPPKPTPPKDPTDCNKKTLKKITCDDSACFKGCQSTVESFCPEARGGTKLGKCVSSGGKFVKWLEIDEKFTESWLSSKPPEECPGCPKNFVKEDNVCPAMQPVFCKDDQCSEGCVFDKIYPKSVSAGCVMYSWGANSHNCTDTHYSTWKLSKPSCSLPRGKVTIGKTFLWTNCKQDTRKDGYKSMRWYPAY